MTIKHLPEIVSKNGYKYHVVTRDSTRALYEQRDGNRVVAYEVSKRLYRTPRLLFKGDSGYESIERFPSDEECGTYCWSYPPNLEAAQKGYDALKRRV